MQIFSSIITVVIIILLYNWFRNRHKQTGPDNWLLRLNESTEDGVSQGILMLGTLFFGVFLLALNRDFNEPITWQTCIFITLVIGYGLTYRYRLINLLVLAVITTPIWWLTQLGDWLGPNVKIQTHAIFTGLNLIILCFYQIGRFHPATTRTFQRFGLVFRLLSLTALVFVFNFLSSRMGLEFLEGTYSGQKFWTSLPLLLSLIIFLLCLIGVSILNYRLHRQPLGELVGVGGIALIFILLLIFPLPPLSEHAVRGANVLTSAGYLWAAFFNILAFGQLVSLIVLGYVQKEEWLINITTFFLLCFILMKYFDWFFTFLDKSLFFIGAGLLLFGIGWGMEKGRRLMLATLKQTPPIGGV